MRDFFAFLYCILICFIIALPIFIFALLSFVNNYPYDITFSFSNIAKTMNMGAGIYLKNSVIIAFFVSLIGTTLSYITAYFSARMKEGGAVTTRLLHMVSITSLAIPGMVLGISYVLFFKGTFLYGTLAMLVLVNTVHFFASPYLMAYNSLGKLNANLEDVGLTLGVSRFHIIKDVLLPQTKWTIIEMASYFFVNCMMTISAVSFLSTVRNMPISLMITQFESQMFLEGAAFVSLLILICNFAIKTGIYFVRKKSGEE
jgi:iron(III) transport system permease protein